MGKSFKDKGEKYFKPVGREEDEDEDFDFREYLRKQEEEEVLEEENDERIEIEDSLTDWESMTEEEKKEFSLKQKKEREDGNQGDR